MPQDKDSKRLVRARVERTGEAYTGAPSRLRPVAPKQPSIAPPDMRVLAAALDAGGILNPATGEAFTATLLFGLSGGIGFSYFVFQYPGVTTLFTHGGYNSEFFEKRGSMAAACERLAIPHRVRQTTSSSTATKHLQDALEANPLVPISIAAAEGEGLPEGPYQLGQRIVGVSTAGDGLKLTDSRDGERICSWDEVAELRSAVAPAKNRLFRLARPAAETQVVPGLISAIGTTGESLLHPRMSNFGIPGMRKWADLLTNTTDAKGWPRIFDDNPARAYRWVAYWLGGSSTDGAAYRLAYAAFLDEAAVTLGKPGLSSAAGGYREVAGQWQELVRGCVTGGATFAELRAILERITPVEEQLATELAREGGGIS